MSVLQLQREDAQPDEKLELHYESAWSAMRSGHADREIFAYTVKSDSGNTYECEVFISDLKTICSFCGCLASELGKRKCRHVRAVLADVIERNPEFGKSMPEGEENDMH